MKSLYIHIPFCKQKCFYCDFNSYSGKDNLISKYVEALKKELNYIMATEGRRYDFNNNKYEASNNGCNDKMTFKTIYFGGGTPSNIPSHYIKEVLELVNCDGEITLELNPGTITHEKLIDYKNAGINRLSIGLQATQDNLLKGIGRIHTLKDFEEAYNLAREVGFKNISVDLMFGLPNQTLKNVYESLEYIIKLHPEHVSCYSLILHDDLVEKNPKAFENLPDDKTEREMYYAICDELKKAGYEQYEISNFAKDGFESKHNLCYWNQDEYYGIGAGASSYVDDIRYKNVDSIEEYIQIFCNGEQSLSQNEVVANRSGDQWSPQEKYIIEEQQNVESKLREYMILKLRLIEGVNIFEANQKFNINVLTKFSKEIEKMVNLGLLEVVNNKFIRLTHKRA